jgi:hypothetical protein
MKPGAAESPWTARFCVLSRVRTQEYERSLRPCLALVQDTSATTRYSEMGSRRTVGRLLFAVLLAIAVAILLVVLLTWGVGAGGSGVD